MGSTWYAYRAHTPSYCPILYILFILHILFISALFIRVALVIGVNSIVMFQGTYARREDSNPKINLA